MFEQKYEKFLKMVNDYQLIEDSTKKVAIAMSGGKDCQSLTALLHEYRKRERPDLELELITAAIPNWKFLPENEQVRLKYADKKDILDNEKKAIDASRIYWEKKGIPSVSIYERPGLDEEAIYQSSNPCVMCFIAVQQAFYSFFEKQDINDEVRLAIGITKWDILYTMINQMLNSSNKTWEERKSEDPEEYKFNLIQFAVFSPYPKVDLGIPGKDICKIQPMVTFNDYETKRIVEECSLPVIPDICVDLNGNKFQSDKRHFDRYVKIAAAEKISYQDTDSPFFPEYSQILDLYQKLGILPPYEDLHKILYSAFMDSRWSEVVKDHDEKVTSLINSANAIH